jgi:two-component system, NtrC family, response regulator AtoC
MSTTFAPRFATPPAAKRHSARPADVLDVIRRSEELRDTGCFGLMVGVSPAMRAVYATIERVAPTDATVFVIGATGTGKELAANMVHRLSRRAAGPFVALNCGAVAANLIESELFGHERGAFTGAERQHRGLFERASGGTLFLDEVTEMAPDLQVRLLRVLERGELVRVGGSDPVPIDVRIIAASNRDPQAAVLDGTLRQDLLYRLYVVPLRMPCLAERDQDLALLATRFLAQLNDEHGTATVFAHGVPKALAARRWPGNVRELRNAVHRAWILSDDVIEADTLAMDERLPPAADAELRLRAGMSIREVERHLIETTLMHVKGDKLAASDLLGISIKTLYTRLSVYAVTPHA